MFLPRTRPLAGILGVGQRRSTTEKETCANTLQRLFFGNISLSSHISLAKSDVRARNRHLKRGRGWGVGRGMFFLCLLHTDS